MARVVASRTEEGRAIADSPSVTTFRKLYRENLADITAYALRRTVSADDAADVIADVFLVVWRRIEQVPTGDAGRLWLFGVARRVLANRRRGDGRRALLSSRLKEDLRHVEPGHPVGSQGVPDGFAEVFAQLSERHREVLGLALWEGLDAQAMGTVLSCSPNAARIRLHRARKQLGSDLLRGGIVKGAASSGHEQDVRSINPEEGR
jgi:RNA polymerase sigma-70 factor (ECF subfamily)